MEFTELQFEMEFRTQERPLINAIHHSLINKL